MKSCKRVAAITLSAVMAAGLMTGSYSVTYAAGNVEKEETVYVTQTSTGDVKSITVSDWLKNVTGTGDIKDKSTLNDIKNVKGNETFTENGDNITWKANDADIYYQGTTSEKPPVGVKISYKLDGKDIKAEDLAGKSGNVEIKLQYFNDTSYEDDVDGVTTKLQSPFLMASAVILPVDNFSEVEVSQGKVVSEGSNQILVAYGVPGLFDSLKLADDTREKLEENLSDTVTIKAKATDFELASIYTIATSDEFSEVDLDENSDMDDLEEALDKLDDASEELVSGTSTLSDGIGTLKDNFKTYASGVTKVSDGASSLSSGAGKLSTGIKQYTDGVSSLTSGAGDYVKGTNSLTKGVKAYVKGEEQVEAGAKTLYEASKDFPTSYKVFSDGLTEYTDGVATLAAADNAPKLSSGAAIVAKGVEDLVDKVETNAGTLQDYAKKANDNEKNVESNIADALTELGKITDTNLTPEEKTALAAAKTALTTAQTDIGTAKTNSSIVMSGAATLKGTMNSDDIQKALIEGAKSVATGAKKVDGAIQTLAGKNKDIKEGSATVSGGITSAVSGITNLYNGIKTLSENNEALTTGAETLEKSGSLLTSGIGQLTSSTKTLTSSAKQLSDGASTLSKGASALDKATDKVSDGVDKLAEGSDKLSDGMSEFKEEGTDKLRNEYNDKVKAVLDRLDSLTGEAGQYNTFSGLADGMNGKVKFIFQTAEIKTED